MNVNQLYIALLQFGLVEYKMENEMNTHKSKLPVAIIFKLFPFYCIAGLTVLHSWFKCLVVLIITLKLAGDFTS